MQRAQQPFEVNVAGTLAAIATLTRLDEVQEQVQRIVAERDHLFHLLAEQPYLHPFPSEGNFILAQLSDTHVCLHQFQQAMESAGIILRYFPQLDKMHDYIRVTIGLPEHTRRLAHALSLLREATGI